MSTAEDPFALSTTDQALLAAIKMNPEAALRDIRMWQQRAYAAEAQLATLQNNESWRTNPDRMGR